MAPTPTANAILALRRSEAQTVEKTSTGTAALTEILLLTRGLAAGGEDAFRRFHKLYFDRLYRFLLAVTRGQEAQAEDALQETMLRVLRYARPFDDEEVFWSWLKTVARSAAHDLGRKNRRYLSLLHRFTFCWQNDGAGREDLEIRMGSLLQESLDELDAADRQLVENKYLDGRTVKELSTLAGATEKAVESRLLRLRRELRERILEKLKSP
jgi:RNA polymerase sigma-70 factor, ECF subfamily